MLAVSQWAFCLRVRFRQQSASLARPFDPVRSLPVLWPMLLIQEVLGMSQSIKGRMPDEGRVGAGFDIRDVRIPPVRLAGTLRVPKEARAFIAFAHGSGSSRLSPRNMAVAEGLNAQGFGTLLFDLLTSKEESDRTNVFDIALLAERLVDAIIWLDRESPASGRPLGLFGASTGAAAALVAAARLGDRIGAVVSRGGRPDLAGQILDQIRTPTLLIVGGADHGVIELNEEALTRLKGPKALQIVPGATHLFPEPGALEAVIDHAARWFARYLAAGAPTSGSHG
jgi:putative phosphoribosyl transferase